MTELLKSSLTDSSTDLLTRYSFDLNGHSIEQLISQWTSLYQAHWIRQAVIEALYQGRYKAISVEQILASWQRRGQPICHFSREFERIICSGSSGGIRQKPEPIARPLPNDDWVNHEAGLFATSYPQHPYPVPVKLTGSAPIPIFTSKSAIPETKEPPLTDLHPIGFDPLFQEPLDLPNNATDLSEPEPQAPQLSREEAITEPASDLPEITPMTSEMHTSNIAVPSEADITREVDDTDEAGSQEMAVANELIVTDETSIHHETIHHETIHHETTVGNDHETDILNLGPFDHSSVLEVLQQQHILILPEASKPPIHQFIPLEEPSEFYVKLKAVAQATQSRSESN